MLHVLSLIVWGGLGILALWLILGAVRYIHDRIWPESKLIVQIKEGGTDKAESFISLWSYMLEPVDLEGFYEISIPKIPDILQSPPQEPAKDVKVEVKGIELFALLQFLSDRLRPPVYTLSGSVQSGILSLQLAYRGRVRKTWYIRGETGAGTDRLLEDAVFGVLFYLRDDPDLPKTWRQTMQAQPDFSSPRASAAYYRGLKSLDVYLEGHRQKDLDQAISEFRTLRAEMPDFHDGLLLLGISLFEDRREEAIGLFDQVLEPAVKPSVGTPAELSWYKTRLLRASARQRSYRVPEAHKAVIEFGKLIVDLEASRSPLEQSWKNVKLRNGKVSWAQLTPDVQRYVEYTILLAQAHVELAHIFGHYLVYLKPDTMKDDLSEGAPGELKLSPDEISAFDDWRKKLKEADSPEKKSQALKARSSWLQAQINKIYGQHTDHLNKARNLANQLEGVWPYRERGERERAELAFRLSNTEGYARYRRATWTATSDEQYRSECEQALAKLQEGDRIRPDHYIVLENMGIIEVDPRFDPAGKRLADAEGHFKRVVDDLKPNDWFGHEQLALVYKRRAEQAGINSAILPSIDEGIKQAKAVVPLRPGSVGAASYLAEFYVMKWQLEAPPEAKKATADLVAEALGQAKRFKRGDDPRVLLAETSWEVAKFRSHGAEGFEQAKKELLQRLGETQKQVEENASPEGWLLKEYLKSLVPLIESSTPKTLNQIRPSV